MPQPAKSHTTWSKEAMTEIDFGSSGAFELEWLIDWAERPKSSQHSEQKKP